MAHYLTPTEFEDLLRLLTKAGQVRDDAELLLSAGPDGIDFAQVAADEEASAASRLIPQPVSRPELERWLCGVLLDETSAWSMVADIPGGWVRAGGSCYSDAHRRLRAGIGDRDDPGFAPGSCYPVVAYQNPVWKSHMDVEDGLPVPGSYTARRRGSILTDAIGVLTISWGEVEAPS